MKRPVLEWRKKVTKSRLRRETFRERERERERITGGLIVNYGERPDEKLYEKGHESLEGKKVLGREEVKVTINKSILDSFSLHYSNGSILTVGRLSHPTSISGSNQKGHFSWPAFFPFRASDPSYEKDPSFKRS